MSEAAMTLFKIEAFWDEKADTTVIRYVEAPDLKTALSVVPEEAVVLSINTLGGLYRPTPKPIPPGRAVTGQ